MCDLFWLTEAQMERLQPYFPKSHCKPRVATQNNTGNEILVLKRRTIAQHVDQHRVPQPRG